MLQAVHSYIEKSMRAEILRSSQSLEWRVTVLMKQFDDMQHACDSTDEVIAHLQLHFDCIYRTCDKLTEASTASASNSMEAATATPASMVADLALLKKIVGDVACINNFDDIVDSWEFDCVQILKMFETIEEMSLLQYKRIQSLDHSGKGMKVNDSMTAARGCAFDIPCCSMFGNPNDGGGCKGRGTSSSNIFGNPHAMEALSIHHTHPATNWLTKGRGSRQ